ncbi:LuxR family transcriptional regulator [Jiella sp. MQZ9-1]|uniref:LuxR family transcriptional regulator n=1 Tax=Jiella flava TaxID=2816857 RepID=A0A939FWH9_9HYPH|nr:LuxR family transcriptional regulator [Jiella flava]MBO0662802.1 LuxR family transcriptional regulator [Jiella flava]MCD2471223.1 LuxR family transcriptional regulator [Jiella flava]
MSHSNTEAMFRFVDCVQHLEDQEAIANELFKTVQVFGFSSFGISGLPQPGESIEPYFLLSGWNPEWFSRYISRDYVHVDPIIARTHQSDEPFTWDEACRDKPLSRKSKQVMNEATEFGMHKGFTVPIYSHDGLSAVVTFGGERIELQDRDRGALHMIAIYAHSQIKRLLVKTNALDGCRAPLSSRERECVLWCAEGKTNWEIGRITGLAEKTVEAYLRNACLKVGAINRAQLVAESIRQRQIT